jgi:sugar phosphate isomerase/epimerase
MVDYFGFSLWHDLLTGDRNWMESMEIPDPREFDPEVDGWEFVFSQLERVLVDSGLSGSMGGVFHVSSNLVSLMLQPRLELLPAFLAAAAGFREKLPLDIGMHCSFGEADLPLAGNYPAVLVRDLELANAIGASCVVEHPPSGMDDTIEAFVAELCSPPVIETLEASHVVLCWENMAHDNFYGSLAALTGFRERLVDALESAGCGDLVDRHLFCLDTGHLVLWRELGRQGTGAAANEIEDCLPEFARFLKVYHIHCNDGTKDRHLVPGSTALFDHPTRAGIDEDRFVQYSRDVEGFIETCEASARVPGRHVHVEALGIPFTLAQIAGFGQWFAGIRA